MSTVLKGLTAGALALLAGVLGLAVLATGTLAAVLLVIDGNDIKPYAARELSSALGRELTIGGDLQVDPGARTRIVVHGVKLADAPWTERRYMAEIARLVIVLELPSLLRGDIHLPEIAIDRPAVTLETAADGRRNWDFLTAGPDAEGGGTPLPVIDALRIGGAVLTYIDAQQGLRMQARIDSAEGSLTGPGRALDLRASGRVADAPLRITAHADGLAPDAGGEPLPLYAELGLGSARLVADGAVIAPDEAPTRAEVHLVAEAPGTAALRAALPWSIPELPGFRFETGITADPRRLALDEIEATLGQSDLRGRVEIERGGERFRIRGQLASRTVDLVQLLGRPTDEPGPLIPETPIDFSPLRQLDAELRVDVRTLYVPRLSLEHVRIGVLLQQGILRFRALGLRLGDGRIHAPELTVDATRQPPEIVADLRIEDLNLRSALAELDLPAEALGTINGGLQLTGAGDSPAAILGSVDGDLQLMMQQGELNQLLITLAGQQIPEVIAAIAGDEDATIPLRCVIADFEARNGVLNTSMLLMDTPEVQVIGGGDIDLGSQRINLAIAPRHKDFSPLAGQVPVHIEGPFQEPTIRVDTGDAVASLITPIELPDTGDADCRALAEAARENR